MTTSQALSDFALIPTPKGVHLLSFTDDRVQHTIPTGLAQCHRHTWLGDSTVAVLVHPTGKRAAWRQVRVLRCEAHRVSTIATLETPILAVDLIAFGGRFAVCGSAHVGARAFILDAFPGGQWTPLGMPPELEWDRKGIDAFATDGQQLIAIDNILLPKWLVRYLPGDTTTPRLADVVLMPEHGSYEHVRTAASGASLFAVHSTTVGREGAFGHLALYRFDSLACIGSATFVSANIHFVMQGDTTWLLHPQYPDRVFRLTPEQLTGRSTPLQNLMGMPLPHPCRTLIRSRQGHVFAIPQNEAVPPIPLPYYL